ncbi:MAG: Holliday junction resolvase-like protein [Candidatus Korobacteraceae bacterium]|jgi:predicted Holliday junction resolvase-like endonuclease
MTSNGIVKDLVAFFKMARHLWGRCPSCGSVFRLSDAAISSSPEPPRDWLRRLERQQAGLIKQEEKIAFREAEVEQREAELRDNELDLQFREDRLERDAHNRVREILRSKTEVQALIREANKASVQRSSATLLGKLLERLAPCFRTFAYDPRDMRCICDPMDYVLFDGLTVERRVRQITFIEVKCGRSRLTPVQRSVREAVENNKVYSEVWEVGNPDIPITKQLAHTSRRALPSGE